MPPVYHPVPEPEPNPYWWVWPTLVLGAFALIIVHNRIEKARRRRVAERYFWRQEAERHVANR